MPLLLVYGFKSIKCSLRRDARVHRESCYCLLPLVGGVLLLAAKFLLN